MSEESIELLEKIMALEPEKRRALAEELYSRMNQSEEDAELLDLAEARWRDFEARKSPGMTHDEMMKSLRR